MRRCQKGTKTPAAARFPVNTVSSNVWRAVENGEEMNNKEGSFIVTDGARVCCEFATSSVRSLTCVVLCPVSGERRERQDKKQLDCRKNIKHIV